MVRSTSINNVIRALVSALLVALLLEAAGLAVWAELYGGNCRVVAYDAYGCGRVCESV